jgi:hypothetical protein
MKPKNDTERDAVLNACAHALAVYEQLPSNWIRLGETQIVQGILEPCATGAPQVRHGPADGAAGGAPTRRQAAQVGVRTMTTDLLGDLSLEGVIVELDRGCAHCGNETLVVTGPGRGPHAATLSCQRCHRNGGWLPKEAAAFIIEIVKAYGRPSGRVIVRNPPVERDRAALNGSQQPRETESE